MATTLSIDNLTSRILWTYSLAEPWGDSTVQSSNFTFTSSLAQGTTAGLADTFFVDKNTLAASASRTLVLTASMTDVFGNTITFAKIKLFYLEVTADTTASAITVGNAAANPLVGWFNVGTDTIKVRNGGYLCLYAPDATGYPVVASTGDQLKLLNLDSVNVATYRLIIVGTSV